jgi:broad specificity phosphatase PhoE
MIFNKENVVIDQRLIERDLGLWSGMSKNEIKSKYPFAFNKNGIMDFYYTPENGEHYENLIKRVADFLVFIHSLNSNIAVVSHNGVFRVMKSLILGIRLSFVFSKREPHLEPQVFNIDDMVINKIKSNYLYTIDK